MPLPIKYNNSANTLSRIVSKEEILEHFEDYQKAISYYRAYPDKFIDLLISASGEDCSFKLYDYQRIMLRGMARYKDIFYTFSRGTSKSFINNLWNIIQCILYPNARLAISASTKGQSAAIVESKISEILSLLPILSFEIKKTAKVKDSYIVYFKNGSTLQNLAAKQSSRGLRFTGLVLEEVVEADPDVVQEVLIPTLAICRRAANGEFNKLETVSQQQICVTTAGYHGSYAYNKLIRTLLRQVSEPGKALVLGGSYRIPIIAGLQNMDFIRAQKLSGTFNPTSFEREYLSRWSNGSDASYFNGTIFDKYRSLWEPVFQREKNIEKTVDYIFGIDVGRFSDASEIAVWKYIPQYGTTSTKHLVALYTLNKMNFEQQAVEIKLLYEKYKPKQVIIDGNGVGAGLIDILIQASVDVRTNQYLAPWGVSNDDKGYYAQFRSADMIPNILYIMKATAALNSEIYANYQTQLTTGKLRFLIDERQAKLRMDRSRSKHFLEMAEDEKLDWIVQFTQTSLLKDQLINLQSKADGINVSLEQINKNIHKDKVSATGYGLWYIKNMIDDPAMKKHTFGITDAMRILNKGMGNRQTNRNKSPLSNQQIQKKEHYNKLLAGEKNKWQRVKGK